MLSGQERLAGRSRGYLPRQEHQCKSTTAHVQEGTRAMAFDELLNEGSTMFRTRWLGYDRAQVDEEYGRLEEMLLTVCADRDAALATAEDLARHLEQARSELAEYRGIHAGHSKDDAVAGCMRYLMHIAKRKAEEIEVDARARTEQAVSRAEDAVGRQARLLDETEQETQRRLAEATQRARQIVGDALEQSRAMLAEMAEQQRLLDQWYGEVSSTSDLPLPRIGEPDPAEPQPVWTAPGESRPADSTPADSTSADSVPNDSRPNDSSLADSVPGNSTLVEPSLTESRLTESRLAEPALCDSALAGSASADSAPAESAVADSALTDSTPDESAPADSAPADSVPADSALTKSTLTDSTLALPTPVEVEQAADARSVTR
ncbi:hypothetical protein [Lentzea sp. E54]|uniref:DivIVA domain-containing protein n=1 Tax=Lentzea xerophila TaxID=3435883 RepID=UPI003DA61A01